jgi:hypothetical protein
MITIVTYFGEQVVKFIFGGRNSGQRRNEEDTLPFIRCESTAMAARSQTARS